MEKAFCILLGTLLVIFFDCSTKQSTSEQTLEQPPPEKIRKLQPALVVNHSITLGDFFSFIDSVVGSLDDTTLTENVLVLFNPWIIDSLQSLDYYSKMKKGIFIYDANSEIVLQRGDSIKLPDAEAVANLRNRLSHTVIDVNIPEFKLRILESGKVIYTFDVRVGRDEHKFLKEAGHIVELETPIGEGEIIRVERNPWYQNPVTGKRYFTSRRDDGQQTKMARIPFIEPTIDGRRQGSLIHPTTNSSTLGKAYSNGCVGTTEANMWMIYFHAPLQTKVVFRYDLKVLSPEGDTLVLKDIYNLKLKAKK